jgi:hypothetical protein
MSFETFEQVVRREAQAFAYPPTPDLAGRVRARLELERARPQRAVAGQPVRRPALALRPALLALVAILIAGAALLLFSPDARAVADRLLRSLQIVFIQPTPTPSPTATPIGTPTPGPSATPQPTPTPTAMARLAGRMTLDEAWENAHFPIRLPDYPPGLSEPDEVYLQSVFDGGQQLILVYRAGPGTPAGKNGVLFTLFEIHSAGLIKKLVNEGMTFVEEVRVNGAPAVWFYGAAHMLRLTDPSGEEYETEVVVDANTLVWEVGDVTYRLETMLPKEEAIRIAESLKVIPPIPVPPATTPLGPEGPPITQMPVTATPLP